MTRAPFVMGKADSASIVRDLSDALADENPANPLERRLDHVLATMACHHSVRAGRRLGTHDCPPLHTARSWVLGLRPAGRWGIADARQPPT